MKSRINLLMAGLGVLTLPGCKAPQAKEITSPNIIYIFPDQLRNHAMGFWNEEGYRQQVRFQGDPVHTPHLNAFARESMVLTSAMSNCPLSSPHRGILLTGMYPHRSGVPLNCNSTRPFSSLREDAVCISDVLSRAGYDCGYFGKLHLDFPTPNDPENPGQYVESRRPAWDAYTPESRRHGFNYWYSYGTFDEHKKPHYWDTNGQRHEIREWSPLHEAQEVVSYLKNERGQRDSSKPFFVMVSMNPPHSPYQSLDDCMEEDYSLYKDIPLSDLLVRPNANAAMDKAKSTPYYYASVTGVDRAFGMILASLKELGLDKNTIVVFTSDHGETMCSQSIDDAKNSPYAEAMNVPFLIRYPEHISPGVDHLLLSTPDIMPTLLGLSGLEEKIPIEVQGENFAPLFLGKDTSVKYPTGVLYFQNLDGEKDADGLVQNYFPSSRGIKTARYTLALYIDRERHQLIKTLMFDDENDPYQLNNLSPKEHAEVFTSLCKEMGAKLKEVGDPWYESRILDHLLEY
ncbi:sulfatase [Bacteroides sp. 51]|uniref:sulfatase family protein n=1 Tax=Bacteroides sp. 51 TaxID=2302938 RepID=UPI0013D86E48|nr:sulfatase [Bacteroides sp. 51]NDV82535.1 arylsulfatase [Bacteroides sp. 51]